MAEQSIQTLENMHRDYAMVLLREQAATAGRTGKIFSPELTPLQMQYRTEIFMMMQAEGWLLTQWAVAGQYPFILGFPVFERIG